jgi:hypothetical protein
VDKGRWLEYSGVVLRCIVFCDREFLKCVDIDDCVLVGLNGVLCDECEGASLDILEEYTD